MRKRMLQEDENEQKKIIRWKNECLVICEIKWGRQEHWWCDDDDKIDM